MNTTCDLHSHLECARLFRVPDLDSSPFVSSQQTTEGELYVGNAQSSSYLTGEPVAYLRELVTPEEAAEQITHAEQFLELAEQLIGPLPPTEPQGA